MTRVLLFLLLALAAPARASAAPFGELPFRAVPGGAACVTAPGAGLIARSSAPAGTQLLSAGADGLRPLSAVPVAALTFFCPRIVAAASGAAVAIGPVNPLDAPHPFALAVAARDPGGAWSRARLLAPADQVELSYDAAVSERGDAAVAVTTDRRDAGAFPLLVFRRAPGGAFSAPLTLSQSPARAREAAVRLGYAADGDLVAAWTHADGAKYALDVAIAPPDGPFGAPQRIGTVAPDAPALAVAPDGSALLAFVAGGRTLVAERAPGAAGFAAPVALGPASDTNGEQVEAALGAGGAAAVAWQGDDDRGVTVATRPAAGPFGAPVVLARPDTGPMAVDQTGVGSGFPIDGRSADDTSFGGRVGVVLAGGQAAVSWPRDVATRGFRWRAVEVAAVPLAGGPATVQRLGSPLRDVASETPLALADGTPAVAWADDRDMTDGRVHLAVAGAPGVASGRTPRVRLARARSFVLHGDASLRLPVRCGAACDVRVRSPFADAVVTLRRAGRAVAALDVAEVHRGFTRRVRLRLAYGAPGSTHPVVRTVIVRVRRV